MLQEKYNSQNKLHVWYGATILMLSAVFYLMIISFNISYNNTHGGGQQTLPGMDVVVTSAIFIATAILFTIQALMQLRISKKHTASIPNFLIAIPIIVFLPLCLKMMGLPGKYCYPLFFCLLVSNIMTSLAIRHKNDVLAVCSFIFIIISISSALLLYITTNNDSNWWDNGHEIVYTEDGVKIKEYEMKKKGIAWGNYTEWDSYGQLTWFRRYPNGALQNPDSAVNYRNGEVWKMRYSFDSAGHHYERQNTYDMSNNKVAKKPLYIQQLVDKTSNLYQYTEWYPDTNTPRETARTFDSCGARYSTHIYYLKNKTISSSETMITTSDYILGSTEALY